MTIFIHIIIHVDYDDSFVSELSKFKIVMMSFRQFYSDPRVLWYRSPYTTMRFKRDVLPSGILKPLDPLKSYDSISDA